MTISSHTRTSRRGHRPAWILLGFLLALWSALTPVRAAAAEDCLPSAAEASTGSDEAACECVCACGCAHVVRWTPAEVVVREPAPPSGKREYFQPSLNLESAVLDLNPRPPKA